MVLSMCVYSGGEAGLVFSKSYSNFLCQTVYDKTALQFAQDMADPVFPIRTPTQVLAGEDLVRRVAAFPFNFGPLSRIRTR